MPELCAAVGLAQCERIQDFVDLRVKMAEDYLTVIKDSQFFIPQKTQKGFKNTYYTFAALFTGDDYGVSWNDFRKKYIENGGDGIYAAHQLVYNEPCFKNKEIGWGKTLVAEKLQKKLMLFTTNQKDELQRQSQKECLRKTINFFN